PTARCERGLVPPSRFSSKEADAPMSRSFYRFAPAFFALTVLVSCAESPSEPMRRMTPRLAGLDVSPSVATQYIVLARGNGFSADLDSPVSSLGGPVQTLHRGAGLAVVSGLSDLAAAQLSRNSDVAEVQADEIVALEEPRPAVQADAPALSDPSASSVANP